MLPPHFENGYCSTGRQRDEYAHDVHFVACELFFFNPYITVTEVMSDVIATQAPTINYAGVLCHWSMWFALFLVGYVVYRWATTGLLEGGGSPRTDMVSSTARDHLMELQRRAREVLKYIHDGHMNADGTLRSRVLVSHAGAPCVGDVCSDGSVDITCAVVRLLKKHYKHRHFPDAGLRVSEYDNDDNDILAVNEDKGRHLRICVFEKGGRRGTPENMNTLMRVLLHELAHSMHCEYVKSKNHGRHFTRLEAYLLHTAKAAGLYECPETDGGKLRVCGRMLPLSSLCQTSRGTTRKPAAAAEAQDAAPESARSLPPQQLLKKCSAQCAVASRMWYKIKGTAT